MKLLNKVAIATVAAALVLPLVFAAGPAKADSSSPKMMHGKMMHGKMMHGKMMHGKMMHGKMMHGKMMHGKMGGKMAPKPM